MNKIRRYGELVMFSHSIFSFSFAVLSAFTAARGLPGLKKAVLILLAFLGGRTCANALNRVIDRKIDAMNPRTASRHIPAGLVGVEEVLAIAVVSFGVMAVAAFFLNPLCAALLPVAGGLFIFYSYTKRFTWLCHVVLGIVCAGASVGAWLAIRGDWDWPVLILAAANAAWVAGFDVVYAIQDIDFDRKNGIRSIPAQFGIRVSLAFTAIAHAFAVGSLVVFGYAVGMSAAYYASVLLVAAMLVLALIRAAQDYKRNTLFASYSANQVVSFILLSGTIVEFVLLRSVPSWIPLRDVVSSMRMP